MLRTRRQERGQVIVLFVAVFSVILVLAAFAIDQGFWYGRRRIVQKDADLAARAGAMAFLHSLGDASAAESAATDAAVANGAEAGTVQAIANATRCADRAGNAINAPSVEVRLDTRARRLFSGLKLVSDDNSPIEVQASSTACVGSLDTLRVSRPQGLPIALVSSGSCFSGGTIRLGSECTVFRADSTMDKVFGRPQSDRCEGSYSWSRLDNDIEDGIASTCSTSGSGCSGASGDMHCLDVHEIDWNWEYDEVMDALHDRLRSGGTYCESRESGEPNRESFQNAFGNGDGAPGIAPDPPPLREAGAPVAAPDHVFVQNDCFNNPRIATLPITSAADPRQVTGFATMYLTGCYQTDDPITVPNPDGESNTCHAAAHGSCPWWWPWCHNRQWELRGIPIQTLVTEGALGGITAPRRNAPLTIQTVK